ncbi:MAG: tetratricopeptide repeat protein [Armatimonadota bacterium]
MSTTVPARQGLDIEHWNRLLRPLDQSRARSLKAQRYPAEAGGQLTIWYRGKAGKLASGNLAIQPGVADDLPSLLSAIVPEIAWEDDRACALPPVAAERRGQPRDAVATWARVWQVREKADLRVWLYWDAVGQFAGHVDLYYPAGEPRALLDTPTLSEALQRYTVDPRASVSPHGLLLAGNRALAADDVAEARACYERTVPDLPLHPEAHRNLALALARLGEWEAASAAIRAAWELAPRDPELGREYLALETDAGIRAVEGGSLDAAADHFLRILAIWPEEPTALVNLGNIRLRQNRTDEARAVYRRYLRLHPRHAAANTIQLTLKQLEELND